MMMVQSTLHHDSDAMTATDMMQRLQNDDFVLTHMNTSNNRLYMRVLITGLRSPVNVHSLHDYTTPSLQQPHPLCRQYPDPAALITVLIAESASETMIVVISLFCMVCIRVSDSEDRAQESTACGTHIYHLHVVGHRCE